MFKVTRTSDNRLDVEFSGKLNKDDMKVLLDELFTKSEGIKDGIAMFRIGEFDFPSLGAIGVELSHMPSMFKFIRKFDKCAVVVAKGWVRKASHIEGAMIPGVTIKAFDVDQETQAEDWLQS